MNLSVLARNTFILIFLLGYSSFLPAQNAGDLDETYGGTGTVISDLGIYYDYCYGMVVQPDQKIVLAGRSSTDGVLKVTLTRLNPDGTTDIDFGTGGIATSDILYGSSLSGQIDPLAIQADGKLVYAFNTGVYNDFDIAVTRFNTDGTIDTDFGENGTAIDASMSSDYYPHSVLVQADGKILVVGQAHYTPGTYFYMAATRFTADGDIDETFADNGFFIFNYGEGDDRIMNAKQQDDGKIVLAGNGVFDGSPTSGSRFEVVRLNEDGTMDETFGEEGIWADALSDGFDYAQDLAIRADGTILVAGYMEVLGSSGDDVAFIALTPDGMLDSTFGDGGLVRTDGDGASSYPRCILIAPDGKILLSGAKWASDIYAFVFRYDANGVLDASFGDGGQVFLGDYSYAGEGIALQADGKIVVNGWFGYDGTNDHDYVSSRLLYEGANMVSDVTSDQSDISIFPNPAINDIYVKWEGLANGEQIVISITDAYGRVIAESVCSSTIHQKHIDLSQFSEGIYSLSVKGKDSHSTERFIVAGK